jgi:D-alanyl-D-alanine carboxypeptidase
MSLMRNYLSLLLMCFVLFSCDSDDKPAATLDADTQAKIKHVVDSISAARGCPGTIVAVKSGNKELFEYAWGMQDTENKIAMTSNLNFRIGSVTKTFTATVVLQLIEEGKLKFEDIMNTFAIEGIDWAKVPYSDQITIAQLINMTSGLYNYTDAGLTELISQDPLAHYTAVQTVQYIYEEEAIHKPGESLNYTNTGYQILGLIVEKVTGNTIGAEITSRIIDKYGLSNTKYPEGTDVLIPEPFCHGYWYDPIKKEVRDLTMQDVAVAGAAGALISNIYDLNKWMELLANGTLLTNETQEKRKTWLPMGFNNADYGYGLMNIKGFLGHAGNISGYSNFSMRNPDEDLTIIAFVNTEDSRPGHAGTEFLLFQAIAKIFVPDVMK